MDETMAKLLTVLPWPYVGGGEADRGGEGRRSRNSSGAVEGSEVGATTMRRRNGVVELARLRMAWPRLQLLAVEGVTVEVAVDDDVGVSAPA